MLFDCHKLHQLGLIKAGGTVVEGTAGNTGIGLAHVCRAKGYKCVIYMPNTQSQEKIDLLRMLGKRTRRSIFVRGAKVKLFVLFFGMIALFGYVMLPHGTARQSDRPFCSSTLFFPFFSSPSKNRRRSAPRPCRGIRQPRELQPPGCSPRQAPRERRLDQPVRQHGQPPRPYRDHWT